MTRLFIHVEAEACAVGGDRRRKLRSWCWRTTVGEGPNSDDVLANEPHIDGAVVFAKYAPDIAWNVVWRFLERFPRRPVVVVAPEVSERDLLRAGARGVIVHWKSDIDLYFADFLLKYRLHNGVFHRVRIMASEHKLAQRQFECLLLRASGVARKDVACRLGISDDTVKKHLQMVAERLGDPDVEAMLRRVEAEANDERFKSEWASF